MGLNFEINIDDIQVREMMSRVNNLGKILHRGMERIGLMLESQVKKNLSGPILRVQTGRLRSSITHATTTIGNEVQTEVGSNVIYLATHEFGAIITPKSAQYLVIPQPDGTFRKVSQVTIPAREPLRRSWLQIQEKAINDLNQTIIKGLEDAN
jgi:phage gpG-like protein